MAREGGHEWYQSIGLYLLNTSAEFLIVFKGPWPFKQQKTILSGLTAFHVYWLNPVDTSAKNLIPGVYIF